MRRVSGKIEALFETRKWYKADENNVFKNIKWLIHGTKHRNM